MSNSSYIRRRKLGICTACGKVPAVPGRTTCAPCARAAADRAGPIAIATWRRRRAAGLCGACGERPPREGRAKCEVCAPAPTPRPLYRCSICAAQGRPGLGHNARGHELALRVEALEQLEARKARRGGDR